MSQFEFLKTEFADVHALIAQAESIARTDPRGACVYARLSLETVVNWLYRSKSSLRDPFETTLSARIHEATFRALVGQPIVAKARIVKDLGNKAAHEPKAVPFANAATSLREFFHIAYWLVRTYAKGTKPAATGAFSSDVLPVNATVPAATLAQLQDVARQFEASAKRREELEAKRLASEAGRKALEDEIAALRAEVAKAKAANSAVPDTHDYDEATTRDAFIDLMLAEAGWTFTKPGHDTEFKVTGMPNNTGDGYVDYVLWGDDGKPLALVEAKRTKRDPKVGRQQAKLYADCLEAQFGQRPIIFYSNGYEHHIWDDLRYPPREVQGFLTKDELEIAIRRRTLLRPLGSTNIDAAIVERFYQTRAIRRVSEVFEKDNLRRALLVMATGSGKTRTVIALSDLLMRANWARRILFLADRVALVNQSVNAYKKFLPAASPVNLVTDKDATGRVYVSTYPTMMRLIDEAKEGKRRFGVGHFDLVVIDEVHRSVYRKYGAIFDYFDSLLVGLTATPTGRRRSRHLPAVRPAKRRADGRLRTRRGCPRWVLGSASWRFGAAEVSARRHHVRRSRRGRKRSLGCRRLGRGRLGPRTHRIRRRQQVVVQRRHRRQGVRAPHARGIKVADGDRLGKTIIFAKNHDHAEFIVKRFDANYPHLKGSFARVIDFQTEYAQSLIDDFSQANKPPHIAVSVDMLDTGIDVPEVVNLVFFKIVRSKTKFWQMIGRGTRLCPDLFGAGRHKEHFQVFDFCQNLEFFNQNLVVAEQVGSDLLARRLFKARVEVVGEVDENYSEESSEREPTAAVVQGTVSTSLHVGQHRELRGEIAERLLKEVSAMNVDNFLVRAKRRYVERYADKGSWSKLGLNERAELIEHVAGLPSELTDDDIAAKQFDLLILRAQLAILRHEASFEGYRTKIIAIAALLEELGNVPMVAKELALILEIQTDEYWQDIIAPMLESVRRRLRDLVKLIELKKRPVVYTDFEDEIGAAVPVAIQGVSVGTDMDRFRLKARHFLKGHENHLAVLKLKRNEPLTPVDLSELEKVFVNAGAQLAEIEQLKAAGGLGLFVRSLVGLERESAKRAFEGFLASKSLSADQIEFLNMVIDYLTERGAMDPRLLYESPFTDIDPMGISGLFGQPEIDHVVSILDDVRRRAAA